MYINFTHKSCPKFRSLPSLHSKNFQKFSNLRCITRTCRLSWLKIKILAFVRVPRPITKRNKATAKWSFVGKRYTVIKKIFVFLNEVFYLQCNCTVKPHTLLWQRHVLMTATGWLSLASGWRKHLLFPS